LDHHFKKEKRKKEKRKKEKRKKERKKKELRCRRSCKFVQELSRVDTDTQIDLVDIDISKTKIIDKRIQVNNMESLDRL
jgi:hypothetical protein